MSTDAPIPALPSPSVILYQNSDFVSGLIQEMLQTGLLESAETEAQAKAGDTESANRTTDGKASAELNVPGIGGASLGGGQNRVRETIRADEAINAERLKYVFSQAYYLDQIRKRMRDQGQINHVSELADAEKLMPGDVVEFSSTFRANEINSVLDIATPELVSTIAKFMALRENRKLMESIDDVDKLRIHRQAGEYLAADYAELGAAVSSALRQDFRSEHTREFYGIIVPEASEDELGDVDAPVGDSDQDDSETEMLTAVTVCDTAHFVTPDPDRLLDGEFTVLGKVITRLAVDVPVLERNKLLNRIDPELLENSLAQLKPNEATQRLAGRNYNGYGVDLNFSALIRGSSFTVLPIAIYI